MLSRSFREQTDCHKQLCNTLKINGLLSLFLKRHFFGTNCCFSYLCRRKCIIQSFTNLKLTVMIKKVFVLLELTAVPIVVPVQFKEQENPRDFR